MDREVYIHNLKVVVIGDPGVGKTSFVRRFSNGKYSSIYKPTIGVDFLTKEIKWEKNENSRIKLQLWDVAGQERFGAITEMFYRNADGALVVYDVTRERTFDGAKSWKKDLEKKVRKDVPAILIANKSDLESKLKMGREDIEQLCKEHRFLEHKIVSVKDQPNSPKRVMNRLIQLIDEKVNITKLIQEAREGKGEENGDPSIVRVDEVLRPPTAPSMKEVCCGGGISDLPNRNTY